MVTFKLIAVVIAVCLATPSIAAWPGRSGTPYAGKTMSPPAGLPAGVTLRAIDGESMTNATTMTHSYYTSNGFSYAVNVAYNGKSWDDPNFFPIGAWTAYYNASDQVAAFNGVKWNTIFTTADTDLVKIRANGIWLVFQPGDAITNGPCCGSETMALLSYDENHLSSVNRVQTTANALQDHRPWWIQSTGAWFYGGVVIDGLTTSQVMNQAIATPNATTRHFDWQTGDEYWFTTSKDHGHLCGALGGNGEVDNIYGVAPCTITQNIGARAYHYGDVIDQQRAIGIASHPAPLTTFVETGEPGSVCVDSNYITPAEMNAAVWASLIHGARMVLYFDSTRCGSNFSFHNITEPFYTTNGMVPQMTATDTLVLSLANVLNSPFALGYVTAVSPARYNFPNIPGGVGVAQGLTSAALVNNGTDVMTKWDGTNFYIFAMPTAFETTTNIPVTFTLNSNIMVNSITVVNEGRTVSWNTSNHQFQDIFANGNTVHIYKIN